MNHIPGETPNRSEQDPALDELTYSVSLLGEHLSYLAQKTVDITEVATDPTSGQTLRTIKLREFSTPILRIITDVIGGETVMTQVHLLSSVSINTAGEGQKTKAIQLIVLDFTDTPARASSMVNDAQTGERLPRLEPVDTLWAVKQIDALVEVFNHFSSRERIG